MGALDQLRGANGDGVIARARSNPWLVVAIAAGAIVFLAWLGWAIYVTSKNGAGAGLGVVIAWPAMLAALTLISMPFVGGYLLVRRLSDGENEDPAVEEPAEEEARDESEEDEGEDPDDEEGADSDSDSDSDSEPEASKAG